MLVIRFIILLLSWTKDVDIFAMDKVFIPIHNDIHWTLAVICFNEKKIQYFDSYLQASLSAGEEYLDAIKKYLEKEHVNKHEVAINFDDWKFVLSTKQNTPQQPDGSNCGVFILMFADVLSDRLEISNCSFGTTKAELVSNLINFRYCIALSIMEGEIQYADSQPPKRKFGSMDNEEDLAPPDDSQPPKRKFGSMDNEEDLAPPDDSASATSNCLDLAPPDEERLGAPAPVTTGTDMAAAEEERLGVLPSPPKDSPTSEAPISVTSK